MKLDTIVCGDCLDVMQDMPDGCVDLIIADLPYGTTACEWDKKIPFDLMWRELKRVGKTNKPIVLFSSQPFTSELVMSNPKWFRYEWIWQKTQAVGHLNAYRQPMRAHENILIFCAVQPIYNLQLEEKPEKDIRPETPRTRLTDCYGTHGLISKRKIPSNKKLPTTVRQFANAQRTVHPTQKPIDLLEYLVVTYSNHDDLVFDFVIGSGTTAVAALKLGRHFYGCDINPEYVKLANERIEKTRLEMSQIEMPL